MKKLIIIAILSICSTCGYAQRNNNNGRAVTPKQQTSASKPQSNGTSPKSKTSASVQHSKPGDPVENKLIPPAVTPHEVQTVSVNVNGVKFNMCYVKGGKFIMGSDDAQPMHYVTLSDYYIGQTEVTQALYNAVTGSTNNKSTNQAVRLSYKQWVEFLSTLNAKTGYNFCMPTEAEWEFAARGGNNTHGYKYSGSDYPSNVGWQNEGTRPDGAHDVGGKQANELGIYDMTGNVWEWCADWYGPYGNNEQINPTGPADGPGKVVRGGDWYEPAVSTTHRSYCSANPSFYKDYNGLRLCLRISPSEFASRSQSIASENARRQEAIGQNNKLRWDEATKTFHFNGQSYRMVPVEGGSFTMGKKPEGKISKKKNPQRYEYYESVKAHQVTLSSYYIGETEFTRGFLRAVTGDYSGPKDDDNMPAGMSWDYCKIIVDYLCKITGKNFCIPSEAEWEFAARGGNRSHGYEYSGCDHLAPYAKDLYEYAVSSYGNGSAVTAQMKAVASKKPNELGLFDMTGNVWEWCADWFGQYDNQPSVNPQGPSTGTKRVYRGGSHTSRNWFYVWDRYSDYPDKTYSDVGFRICLRP